MHDEKILQDPTWWQPQISSSWDRVKDAFHRDWVQTRHDMGSKTAVDLDQNVDDTMKQMAGNQSVGTIRATESQDWVHSEAAFRFGYGARIQYGPEFPEWNEHVEDRLRADWKGNWKDDRESIRRGWSYSGTTGTL